MKLHLSRLCTCGKILFSRRYVASFDGAHGAYSVTLA